jgi:hypothetical protein
MELIDLLTNTLGVNADQATGGAGLLFKLAKEKLGDTDFSQISQHVPGVNELIESAPESGGIAGALGGLASALGGSGSELGNLASLAGGFSKLELDSGMIGKFIPVILSFVESKGGGAVKGLLEQALT